MTKPKVLVVALDPPTQLAVFTSSRRLMAAGSVERKYFVGSGSFDGHAIRHHSSGLGDGAVIIAMRGADTHSCEERDKLCVGAPRAR